MSTTRILYIYIYIYIYIYAWVCVYACYASFAMVSCSVLPEHRKKCSWRLIIPAAILMFFLVLRVRHKRHKQQNTAVSIACLLCFHSNPSSLVTRKIKSSGISRATPWIAAWETNQTDFLACGYYPNLSLGPCILKEIRENQFDEWDCKAARLLSKFKMAASSLKFLAH